MKLLLLALLPLLSFFQIGCSNTYYVKVESSFKQDIPQSSRYFLQSANKSSVVQTIDEDFRTAITTDLFELGLSQANTIVESDFVIVYGYGIREHVEETVRFRGGVPYIKTDVGSKVIRRTETGYQVGDYGKPDNGTKPEMELRVIAYEKFLLLKAWNSSDVLNSRYTELSPIWEAKSTLSNENPELTHFAPYLSNAAIQKISSDAPRSTSFVKFPTKAKNDPYALVYTALGQ